ncbi:MAG: membrane protein insertase YidC, partial [Bacteroidaceae bacterium]|nr:membrane protein insertase YidC [Bacteroidaceae bacterium]
MDKNTITGFILIILVIWGFSYFGQPSQQEIEEQLRQDSIAAAQLEQQALAQQEKARDEIKKEAAAATDSASLFFAHRSGAGQDIVLENSLVRLTLNTKGGTVTQAVLKKYLNQQKEQVTLFDAQQANLQLLLDTKTDNIRTRDLTFTALDQDSTHVTMRLKDATRGCLDIIYALQPDGYMLTMDVRATGMQDVFPTSTKTLNIQWIDRAYQQEKGFDFENRYAALTYKKAKGGTDYLSETQEESESPEQALDWVAFKNQFFSCVLIAHQDFTHADLKSVPEQKGTGFLKTYRADLQTAFDPTGAQPTQLQLYIGPNDFHLLQEANEQGTVKKDLELEELVYLGWPLFRWINRWFILYLFDWLTGWGFSMGLVLFLLTIIVKAVVYPPTKKSFMSSAKMRVLKPQVDALGAKYPKKEDAMRKQQEMMQLYSQYGVSPMGGCLPSLIQMPIWIALFNFVPNAIQLRGESFLWADDLSAYDELLHWDTDLWLIGDHISVFCVLFSLTSIINSWLAMRQQQNQLTGDQAQQMKMMQYMMLIMPVMFFFMFNNYSSGLCYYYFLSGLTNILLMWYLRKTTDDKKLLEKLEAYRAAHKN